MRRRTRRVFLMMGGVLAAAGIAVGVSLVPGRAGADATASPTPVVAPESTPEEDNVKLYQLLYDYHFTEPLSTLGQKVRILIWLDYLGFSSSQKQQLLTVSRKFQERYQRIVQEQEEIIRKYEQQLEPLYQQVYEAISVPSPNEEQLDTLARQIKGVNLTHKREDELQTLRIGMVRAIFADEKDFLQTLSPEQEGRLVTSLFFLRRELDPFAQPGNYRSVIGPTWNAGDFSSLLKQKARKESHLNIGGLWGMGSEDADEGEYANIQRPIVLFFALKEPALIPALEESIARGRSGGKDDEGAP